MGPGVVWWNREECRGTVASETTASGTSLTRGTTATAFTHGHLGVRPTTRHGRQRGPGLPQRHHHRGEQDPEGQQGMGRPRHGSIRFETRLLLTHWATVSKHRFRSGYLETFGISCITQPRRGEAQGCAEPSRPSSSSGAAYCHGRWRQQRVARTAPHAAACCFSIVLISGMQEPQFVPAFRAAPMASRLSSPPVWMASRMVR